MRAQASAYRVLAHNMFRVLHNMFYARTHNMLSSLHVSFAHEEGQVPHEGSTLQRIQVPHGSLQMFRT